jgi:hypothetical protein
MDPLANEEPRSKLLGIFVGEEIYYTGLVHTPIRKLGTTFSVVVNLPEQAPGYGPGLPINKTIIRFGGFENLVLRA